MDTPCQLLTWIAKSGGHTRPQEQGGLLAAAKHRSISVEEHSKRSANVVSRHAVESSAQSAPLTSNDALSRENAVRHYTRMRRARSWRGLLRGFLVVFIIALLGVGGFAWAYINNINKKLTAGANQDLLTILSERDKPSDPFYMLLLGVDKGEERVEEDGEEYWNYRADTIILARIDPQDVKVTLVSIPRDTYVDMGDNGAAKINAAYSYGGPSYMVEVVQEFAGVPISHYAEIDFDAFVAVVDGVGGIDVNLPVPVSDPEYTELELDAGQHHLNGWEALMLCRSRHAYDDYGGGDFYRAANQRMVISAIARKVLESDLVTMSGTISTLADYVTTDMDLGSILSLAAQMKDLNIDENFYSGQEPTVSTYYDDVWYEICDTEAWQEMMRRVDAGLPPYESEDQDFTSGIAGGISMNGGSPYGGVVAEQELDYSGTVAVYNGAGVDGLAGTYADNLSSRGFATSAETASAYYDYTFIIYNGDDAVNKAKAVAEAVGGEPEIYANDGTYPTDANVVLVLGGDRSE